MAASKGVTVKILQLQPNGDTLEMTFTFATEEEKNTFLRQREEKKQNKLRRELKAQEEQLKKNGGSDRLAVPEYENPGLDELEASLDIVQSDWYTQDEKQLYCLLALGRPPVGVTVTRAPMKVLEPATWLESQMHLLRFKSKFVGDRSFHHGRLACMQTLTQSWRSCVIEYNGHVKTIKELFMWARDKKNGLGLSRSRLRATFSSEEEAIPVEETKKQPDGEE